MALGKTARLDRKERILAFVTAYSDEHGYAPTYREICNATGYRSCSTAHRYVTQLEQEGKLVLRSRKARTVKPIRQVRLEPSSGEGEVRIRLQLADGGLVYFDCVLGKGVTVPVDLKFDGVFDATQLKSKCGRLVSCSVEDEEEDGE